MPGFGGFFVGVGGDVAGLGVGGFEGGAGGGGDLAGLGLLGFFLVAAGDALVTLVIQLLKQLLILIKKDEIHHAP